MEVVGADIWKYVPNLVAYRYGGRYTLLKTEYWYTVKKKQSGGLFRNSLVHIGIRGIKLSFENLTMEVVGVDIWKYVPNLVA